jgi:hypothetical protein
MPPATKKTLEERLKGVAAAGAPSMIPVSDPPPPPPKVEEVIPQLSDLIQDRKKRLEMARLVSAHGELGEQVSTLNKQRDKLTAAIKKLAGENSIAKCISGDWQVNYFASTRESIKKDKLLALGVSPGVILAATAITHPLTLKVTRIGEEDEE